MEAVVLLNLWLGPCKLATNNVTSNESVSIGAPDIESIDGQKDRADAEAVGDPGVLFRICYHLDQNWGGCLFRKCGPPFIFQCLSFPNMQRVGMHMLYQLIGKHSRGSQARFSFC